MKILQINAVGQTGSTGRNCAEIAAYVNAKTPHTCHTAFAVGEAGTYTYRIGSSPDRKLHALFSRITGKQAHFSRRATHSLLKYMDTLKPDVVTLNNLHGNYIHLPMLLRYLAKRDIATVLILHDCWFFTGKCCHYTAVDCYRWQTGCRNCPQLKTDNVSWLFDRTRSLWREKKRLFEKIPRLAVIGVSDWITAEARKSYLSCAANIRRIYNWIDTTVFAPQDTHLLRNRLQLTDKRVILAVSATWSRKKGLDKFLRLATILEKAYAIVMIGQMPAGLTLPPSVISVPPTASAAELAAYYSMADVFVNLSVEETFGKVSAEALACGTPVVCLDSTANKELIGKGCGSVLPLTASPEALREAIDTICSTDKTVYRQVCRSFALQNFEKDMQIAAYVSLFEDIIDRSNHR